MNINILLVEDDPVDAQILLHAFKKGGVTFTPELVDDGEKALAYLRRQGAYASAKRPDAVFLDLYLPKVNGMTVLREMKEDPELRSIPVVVLTASKAHEDVVKSYGLGASCYISKPADSAQIENVAKVIREFWLSIVTLPPHSEGT